MGETNSSRPFLKTGYDLIDMVRAVQFRADQQHTDPDNKISYIKQSLATIGARELLGQTVQLEGVGFLGCDSRLAADSFVRFDKLLTLSAPLDMFGYLYDPDLPVDTLTLDCGEANIVLVEGSHSSELQELRFRVPIVAIQRSLLEVA